MNDFVTPVFPVYLFSIVIAKPPQAAEAIYELRTGSAIYELVDCLPAECWQAGFVGHYVASSQ